MGPLTIGRFLSKTLFVKKPGENDTELSDLYAMMIGIAFCSGVSIVLDVTRHRWIEVCKHTPGMLISLFLLVTLPYFVGMLVSLNFVYPLTVPIWQTPVVDHHTFWVVG